MNAEGSLYAHLDRAGLATVNQRGYLLLMHAAQTGLICCGAPHAGQHTLVLLADVLVNGRVHGTWWHENKRGQLRLSRAMFKHIPRRAMPILVETTARYAQYAGLPAVWGAG